jgi:UDP-2,3-diacylglucosamine pyrophosphatase LpxH
MSIRIDGARISTAPSAEETEHGLGNAEDHARIKLERVLTRHANVFDELAAFVADGHAVTFVHGNHDLEFHWPAVQARLKADLLARATVAGRVGSDDAFLAQIDFAPWFFYRDGVAYIEHGHQYDRFCATDHVMAPLSPLDPRRIARGFCDVLLRFVVRPTRGMSEHGHEDMGMLDYLRFAARLGITGMAKLGVRFTRAILELFRLRRGHFAEAARTLRAEHERRMAALSEATRIGLDKLRALAALQSPPITRSVRGILASLLLDRLAVTAAGALTLLGLAIFVASRGRLAWSAALVVAAWYAAHRYLSSQRQLDPRDQMRDRAGKLVKLFPAAFVVMGHTHVPERVPVSASSGATAATTYINLGSWAEEEETDRDAGPDADPDTWTLAFRAARTHLVIRPLAEGAEAEFLTWDPDMGPKRFEKT